MTPDNGEPAAVDKPTARTVKDALHRKYRGALLNGEQWVCIEEARSGAGFDGNTRQCDFLAVNTFKGRGLHLIGHEVKVSLADWKQELAQPEKAEAFARFCRQWYVVVPSDLASKIKDDVPPTWGLMSLSPKGALREVVKAPARQPDAVDSWWWIGWLAQIDRQHKRAVEATVRERVAMERETMRGQVEQQVAARMDASRRSTETLRENAAKVREATGLDIQHLWNGNVERLRQAWALASNGYDLEALVRDLRRTADQIDSACGRPAVAPHAVARTPAGDTCPRCGGQRVPWANGVRCTRCYVADHLT